jgi:hypothetical protein
MDYKPAQRQVTWWGEAAPCASSPHGSRFHGGVGLLQPKAQYVVAGAELSPELWSLSPTKRKGKGLVRRMMLFLGAVMVMLVVAGGVALATDAVNGQCGVGWSTCQCTGGLCKGTPDDDTIFGTNESSGDKIFAYGGDDGVDAADGGDYVDAGPGNDIITGDYPLSLPGNDTLIGGDGNDENPPQHRSEPSGKAAMRVGESIHAPDSLL